MLSKYASMLACNVASIIRQEFLRIGYTRKANIERGKHAPYPPAFLEGSRHRRTMKLGHDRAAPRLSERRTHRHVQSVIIALDDSGDATWGKRIKA